MEQYLCKKFNLSTKNTPVVGNWVGRFARARNRRSNKPGTDCGGSEMSRHRHARSEFFHERCVAIEKTVKVDPLLKVCAHLQRHEMFDFQQFAELNVRSAHTPSAKTIRGSGGESAGRVAVERRKLDKSWGQVRCVLVVPSESA
jgi:hypothetical protein